MNGEIQEKKEEFDLEKNNVIKKYFSRIFTILKSDIREKLDNLDLNEKKKKKIKQELAYLPHYKQNEYLDEIANRSQTLED